MVTLIFFFFWLQKCLLFEIDTTTTTYLFKCGRDQRLSFIWFEIGLGDFNFLLSHLVHVQGHVSTMNPKKSKKKKSGMIKKKSVVFMKDVPSFFIIVVFQVENDFKKTFYIKKNKYS